MATRFWVGGGSSVNWNATVPTNWSATSGGSNNASVPGASDDVTFDGAGANGNTSSTVSATITILSLTFTAGYTQTVTLNAVPTVAGNFTDNAAHSWFGFSGLTISATSTIASGGKTFPNDVTFSGSNTKTINGNWTIGGTLIFATSTTTVNKTTAEVISCAGLTCTGNSAGTINITLTGGTWSGIALNAISGTITLDGNITVNGQVRINGCTLTYTSGTITASGSTLTFDGNTTYNANPVSWGTISISGGTVTITINSLLTCTGTMQLASNSATTFAGTSGWITGTLQMNNNAATSNMTLKNSVTYTVTTAFNASGGRVGNAVTITSDDGTLKAILTVYQTASTNVNAFFTRIDASGGRVINTFNGTITTCTNIFQFNDGLPSSVGRVSLAGATY